MCENAAFMANAMFFFLSYFSDLLGSSSCIFIFVLQIVVFQLQFIYHFSLAPSLEEKEVIMQWGSV